MYLQIYVYKYIYIYIYIYIYLLYIIYIIYINIYVKQVKQESRLTPSKDDHKLWCILEALQVQIYKSKK